MIDVAAAVRELLADDETVAGLAGSRIYATDLLPAGYSPSQGPAVQIFIRGGAPDVYLPLVRPSVQIRTWAVTPGDAWNMAAAVYNKLRGCGPVVLTDGVILEADAESQPQFVRDAGTNWPSVLAYYKFIFRE